MNDDQLFERIQVVKWFLNWILIATCLSLVVVLTLGGFAIWKMWIQIPCLFVLAYRFCRRAVHRCPTCGPRSITQGWFGHRKHSRYPSIKPGHVICETSFVCYRCESEQMVHTSNTSRRIVWTGFHGSKANSLGA
jgi:hypothetical protein